MESDRDAADDLLRRLQWELRFLLAGQAHTTSTPLSALGIERWQLELAVQRLLLPLPLPDDTVLTPALSLQDIEEILLGALPEARCPPLSMQSVG